MKKDKFKEMKRKLDVGNLIKEKIGSYKEKIKGLFMRYLS